MNKMETLSEQITRIEEMEAAYDRASEAACRLSEALTAYESVLKDVEQLSEYYQSGQWMDDFTADEEGLLPRDLKRGVLSEDGIDELLSAHAEIIEQMVSIMEEQ